VPHLLARGRGEAELLQQLVRAAARRRPVEVVQPGPHREVLAAGEDLVDRGGLAEQPDPAPDLVGLGPDVEPGHPRGAAVRPQQRGEDADRRGLPRAVGPEQAAHRAGRHPEVDAGQRRRPPVALPQPLGHDPVRRHGHLPI
jgi:hypothetical protein